MQERLLSSVRIVMLKQGTKLYEVDHTFNVIIEGMITDHATGKELRTFDVFADHSLQVNMLDYSCPIVILDQL